MRVAWVHPTWRDLVIERLAGDAALRARFLGRCGPHGVALALSTRGGAAGERGLPLVAGDEDWDAIGDRIYALVPELDWHESMTLLVAVDDLLEAVADDPRLADEAAALVRVALERFDEVWRSERVVVTLPCIDAWLSAAARLKPRPWPSFLGVTWANLLPARLPHPDDLADMQSFTDWLTLCEMAETFSPDLLDELGYGAAQRDLLHAFRDRELRTSGVVLERMGGSEVDDAFIEESRARRISENVVRRVLSDL